MKITIGILAWNEEATIKQTLQALSDQSLFKKLSLYNATIDIICVPNGSTDKTIENARDFFAFRFKEKNHLFSWQVQPIKIAGKANAWNTLVHHLASNQTDYFFILDGDITVDNPNTLLNMLDTAIKNPEADIVTDLPKKLIISKGIIMKGLLSKSSEITSQTPAQLSGQLYCIKGKVARKIWIPMNLIVEDGFIKEWVTTNAFKNVPDISKIIRAEEASHTFVEYSSFTALYRHQMRQIIGQSTYYILKEWLQFYLELHPQTDIGELINKYNQLDSNWFLKMVNWYNKNRFWVVYPHSFSARFRRLKYISSHKLRLFFVSCLYFIFDIPILIHANFLLKRLHSLQNLWIKEKKT